MPRADYAIWLAALLLAGCNGAAPDEQRAAIDDSNPLEVAARERGIVRVEAEPPTGVYERRHELGRDAMCVVPAGAGEWRFTLTAAFGPGLSCLAAGRMTREGDDWRMMFDGVDGCEAIIREDDDELWVPGSLSPLCDSLCPGRASLAGLRLPRASWSEADAKRLQMRGEDGIVIQPCGG